VVVRQTTNQLRRLAKPSARELYDHKHVAVDIEERGVRQCACIVMHDHEEKETIYG
jgi:hypothetical protein